MDKTVSDSRTIDFDFKRSLSASLLRLRSKTPFFATLALFAHIEPSPWLATAATDGRDIWINPEFWHSLPSIQADGLLLHEVLHAALLHIPRRGEREPLLWNYAADIVVNGIILEETPFQLPEGSLREFQLEKMSVEEVYEILQRDVKKLPQEFPCDLFEGKPGSTGKPASEDNGAIEGISAERRRLLENYWRQAREQAVFIASSTQGANAIAGLQRELAQLQAERLPWRDYLWRFLVRTPTDFVEFDRRFLSRKLYLETIEGESVRVFVCVDTSGSVNNEQMQLLLSEVGGILRAYPHLQCDLFYGDAEAYGPFHLSADQPIPRPIGGGGTNFGPFFRRVAQEGEREALCVYLTDGYGTFPPEAPENPVLWVVTAGGLDLREFPFGETVRLSLSE